MPEFDKTLGPFDGQFGNHGVVLCRTVEGGRDHLP